MSRRRTARQARVLRRGQNEQRPSVTEAADVASGLAVPPPGVTSAPAVHEARVAGATTGEAGGMRRPAGLLRGQQTSDGIGGILPGPSDQAEDARGAGTPAASGNAAGVAAAPRQERPRKPRDPRLGQYDTLGGLLNRALREHRLDARAVRRIAGLAPHEPNEALLDLPGGLDGVWQAVDGYVIGEGMRSG